MKNLKYYRTKKGYTQSEVAKKLNISKQAYSHYELGKRQADFETCLKLAEILDTTVDELLRGSPSELATHSEEVEVMPPTQYRQIPVYESVSAGFGAYANDCIVGYMPLFIVNDEEAAETIIIRVRGDSMYPRIEDGSLVQVHKQNYADNGRIVVVLIDGEEAVIKRYFCDSEKGVVRLESYNPEYPPRVFRGSEIERLKILGVAVRVTAEL